MVFHPRDPGWRCLLTRRELLRRAGAGAVGAGLGGSLLTGCATGKAAELGDDVRVLIGTRDVPAVHPYRDDNPPIASDLDIEAGPLRLFNWAEYIHLPVVKRFCDEYGVDYEITTFYNNEEAIRKLRTGAGAFDIYFPTAESNPKIIAGRLLQPLNHDYLPNVADLWPTLRDSWYDFGCRYTVPYSVYQTGITWRTDMVSIDFESMDNPWLAFWDPAYYGLVGMYDDFRESLGVGLYVSGSKEIATDDPELIDAARRKLLELIDRVNIRFTIDGAYAKIPERGFALHHAWSGDVVQSPVYYPEGADPSVQRYMWPPRGRSSRAGGVVSADTFGVPRNAEHPVLAHHFINFMLETDNALDNFGWIGNPPPLTNLDPSAFVADGHIPEYLASTITVEEDFEIGQIPTQLPPTVEMLWLNAWASVQSGG